MGTFAGFDPRQAKKAVLALMKHVNKEGEKATELLEDDEVFHLGIQLKRTPQDPRRNKPVRIPVPHSLYKFEGAEVCLIVKDRAGEGHKDAKQRVKEQELAGVAKVIGVSKLRTKYESHEAKRNLCGMYDLFLADERILPSLPKLLGKAFFRKKKQPIPVDLRTKDWGAQVEKALGATYMYRTGGSCLNIRFARSSFTERECIENLVAVLKGAVPNLPKKWAGVQSVFIKTSESVALPVYQSLPDKPLQITAER